MPVDEALLESHRRYRDDAAGISEEFLQPRLGAGATVAVLARPLGPSRPVGWVICHSFGMEQLHLGRLDVVVARALSAAGFPVLRYHGQGYGDSDHTMEAISLSSHTAEASDAVDLVAGLEGIRTVGIMGARFGGTVAALVAKRRALPLMALWEPVVAGGQYMRDFLRTRLLSEVVAGNGGSPSATEKLREELEARGVLDVNGFALTRDMHEAISSLDVLQEVSGFRGQALLVAVSRTGRVSPSVNKLAVSLEQGGATCKLEVVQDPMAAQFGHFHFQTVEGGRAKLDTQFELNRSVAHATVAWAQEMSGEDMASGTRTG